MTTTPWANRHPSTQHFARVFTFEHLPAGPIRTVSRECAEVAEWMLDHLQDGPELTAGLRKLREAKDCFVLQAVFDRDNPQPVDQIVQT